MNGSIYIDGTNVKGKHQITLDGSKSISNRVLIIQRLCKEAFTVSGLSTSDDTKALQKALESEGSIIDVHHAGTSFRFLTSMLSLDDKQYTLTGSSRMKERPIGPLVESLRAIGASIDYLEKDGFPPLSIHGFKAQATCEISILGSISSQFISSLLLVAPCLKQGLILTIEGELVSRPYIQMTLRLMAYFGIEYQWEGTQIKIAPQSYVAKDITIEGDWSAASYYFGMVATNPDLEITLHGLQQVSLQGDAAIVDIMKAFGVESNFKQENHSIIIKKVGEGKSLIEYNFIKEPDLAQTVVVCAAANNKKGLFNGLKTLKIKETDRIEALKIELQKFGAYLSLLPTRFTKKEGEEFYMLDGELTLDEIKMIQTYKDHRMAMCFAILGIKGALQIENAEVVSKSYPNFWEDLSAIGYSISKV